MHSEFYGKFCFADIKRINSKEKNTQSLIP
jgi:hypothetical protein